MQTLTHFTPDVEVYSIDESFIRLSPINGDLAAYGSQIRATVLQWTGIPVSLGWAATKLANKV
jgi:DNA polymerase V